MTREALRGLLEQASTIAVVGVSPNPARPSHQVASYLQDAGYRIIPINPFHRTILGEPSFPTLAEADRNGPIDIVDVFRRSERAGAVVDEAIAIKPRLIWLQVGVRAPAAASRAAAAGIACVMDRRLMVDHQVLCT